MLSDFVLERISRLSARRTLGCNGLHQNVAGPRDCDRNGSLPGHQRETASGSYWHIDAPLQHIVPRQSRGAMCLPSNDSLPKRFDDDHPELAALRRAAPAQLAFLDLETCGFSGSPIFLIGLVVADRQGWVVRQLLARTYAEEAAILDSLWRELKSVRVLVTFNGKSFDWPVVKDRTIRYRPTEPLVGDFLHCDLLHHARRWWKEFLPNCKLQTLEIHVCGRYRRGDIAGQDIPRVYDQFVRSGEAAAIRTVLHHNTLDLVTLVQLARVFGMEMSQQESKGASACRAGSGLL